MKNIFKKIICMIAVTALSVCTYNIYFKHESVKGANAGIQIGAEGSDVTANIEEIDGVVTLTVSGSGVIADDPFNVVHGEIATYILYEISSYYEYTDGKEYNTLLTYVDKASLNYNDCRNILKRLLVEKVVVEEGITEIGAFTFYGMLKLSSVELPDTLTKISDGAFMSCPALKEVEKPASVKRTGGNALSFNTFGNYKDGKRSNSGVLDAISVLNDGVDPFVRVKLTGMHYFDDFAIIDAVDNYTKNVDKILITPASGDYRYNKIMLKTMFTNSNILLIIGISLVIIIDLLVFMIVAKRRKKNKKI